MLEHGAVCFHWGTLFRRPTFSRLELFPSVPLMFFFFFFSTLILHI